MENQYQKELKPKKKLGTKLEETRKQKKEDYQADEKLAWEGQESEKKGRKAIAENVKLEERKDKKIFNTELEWLTHKRKFRDEEYLTALASVLYEKLKAVDWPLGYHYRVEVAGRKIKAEFTDPYQRKFAKGIKACGIVKYDHHAVKKLAIEAENTVDRLEGDDEFRKTKSGIYLP